MGPLITREISIEKLPKNPTLLPQIFVLSVYSRTKVKEFSGAFIKVIKGYPPAGPVAYGLKSRGEGV